MKYSILIPVYNVEKYIDHCLKSVIHQTYQDYEVIIYIDGSKDGSEKICRKYEKNYPKKISVIKSDVNIGLILSREILLKQARGDYVLCVDSDDFIDYHLLEKVNAVIEKASSDIVIYNLKDSYRLKTGGYLYRIRNDIKQIENIGKKEMLSRLSTFSYNSIWRKVFKKKLWSDERIEPEYRSIVNGEDLYLSTKIINKADLISLIPEALYYYRSNVSSITHNFRIDSLEDELRTMEYLKEVLVSNNIFDKCRDTYNKNIYRILMSYFRMMSSSSCHLSLEEKVRIYNGILKDGRLKELFELNKRNMIISAFLEEKYIDMEKLIRRKNRIYTIKRSIGALLLE